MTPEVQEVFKLFENYLESFMATKYTILSNGDSNFGGALKLIDARKALIEKLEKDSERR